MEVCRYAHQIHIWPWAICSNVPNQGLPIDSDDHDLAIDARNMHGIVMLIRANIVSLHSPFDHPKHYSNLPGFYHTSLKLLVDNGADV